MAAEHSGAISSIERLTLILAILTAHVSNALRSKSEEPITIESLLTANIDDFLFAPERSIETDSEGFVSPDQAAALFRSRIPK